MDFFSQNMNKKITITTEFSIFENLEELPIDIQNLMEQAIDVRKKAYAPYSKFKVGTALFLDNGKVVLGSNQENAAYPSGLCAERVAIFWTGANYPGKKIVAMAITASSDLFTSEHPIAPCGACRQAMLEYELNQKESIQLIMQGGDGDIIRMDGVKNLLPIYFHEDGLKK